MPNQTPQTAFRRPVPPAPIESYDLPHPAVPPELDGLSILHITDQHVTRPQAGRRRFGQMLAALRATPADLVVLTGDYMTKPGHEADALAALAALEGAWTARFGAFGIFGNHDYARFRRSARAAGSITWLDNQTADVPGLPLRLVGASFPEDLLGTLLSTPLPTSGVGSPSPASTTRLDSSSLLFQLALAHMPTEVFAAAEFGLPIILCGHTHGGQFRVSPRFAPHTSSDLPPQLAAGILRLRNTLCCISRGVGDALVELRFNCPPQIPLYTLRRAPLPSMSGGSALRAESRKGRGVSTRSGESHTKLTQVVAW